MPEAGAASPHVLHEAAGRGTPGKRGVGWRLVECGGSGVAPEGAFGEPVKALLRLALWLWPPFCSEAPRKGPRET